MPKATKETTVDDTGAPAPAAATPAAPEAPATSGDASTASEIISEAQPAPESVLAEVPTELSKAEQAVLSWFNDHAYSTPISRATEALNYLREHAVPDLINRIKEI